MLLALIGAPVSADFFVPFDGTRYENVRLQPVDSDFSDRFAWSLDMDGTRFVAGLLGGGARVFERQGGAWVEAADLAAAGAQGSDGYGWDVAISGDLAMVAAPYQDDGLGAVHVFERLPSGAWSWAAKLTTDGGAQTFGQAVALDGTRAIVGAVNYAVGNASQVGAAYVFERQADGTWFRVARLTASDGAARDLLGFAVALDGDTALVGAPDDDNAAGPDAGAAYVFERQGDASWAETGKLVGARVVASDAFGTSVALDGTTAVVAPFGSRGYALVYERQPGSWVEAAELSAPAADVALAGDTIVLGYDIDWGFERERGLAYLYHRNASGGWTNGRRLVASDGVEGHRFGGAVAIQGRTVVIGSELDSQGARGAAYVYDLDVVPGPFPPEAIVDHVDFLECAGTLTPGMLRGGQSFDVDGTPLTFAWSAPGAVLASPNAPVTSGQFPFGDTQARLTVTDGSGATDTQVVTVHVFDTRPPSVSVTRPVTAGLTVYINDAQTVRIANTPVSQAAAVGPLTVQAAAVDTCGMVDVTFTASFGTSTTDAQAPYEFVSSPPLQSSRTITVTADARDVGSNHATASVQFLQVGTHAP
ncbi:MAG TPA: hypothetical protein VGR28_10820 [Candidatus Thermoplasmatota archaeon]|nr:hypothetical protein [Candidatus Thermoplasmatota archaeon]